MQPSLPTPRPLAAVLLTLLCAIAASTLLAGPALAQSTISYQGYLEQNGVPVNDASAKLTFRLFSTCSGGSALWTETMNNIPVTDGLFNVALGSGTALPNTLFDGSLCLSVAVGGSGAQELSPRTALRTAPYARTLTAPARVTGTPTTDTAVLRVANTGTLGYGLYAESGSPYALYGTATAPSGTTYGVYGQVSSPDGFAGYFQGRVQSTAEIHSASEGFRFPDNTVQATAASPFTLPFTGSASTGQGVLTVTNTQSFGITAGLHGVVTGAQGGPGQYSIGVWGEASSASGRSYGVMGTSATSLGRGVYGIASHGSGSNYGVVGESASISGYGVAGFATSVNGSPVGVYGSTVSNGSGKGIQGAATATSGLNYGGYFTNASSNGRGVAGIATNAAIGDASGGYFESASTAGRGVTGIATNTGSETAYGGYFSSASTMGRGVYGQAGATATSGRGVYGEAAAATGTTYGGYFTSASTSGRGVYGEASAAGAGTVYGVYGRTGGSATSGRGVYGEAVAATGTTYGGYFTSSSTSGRGVYGRTGVDATSGRAVFGEAGATSGTNYGGYFTSSSGAGYGLYASNAAGGYAARFANLTRFDLDLELYDGDGTDPNIILDVDEGGEAPAIKLRRDGVNLIELDGDHNGNSRIITDELELNGSDLAEHFDVRALDAAGEAPQPGTVVCIDPEEAGRLVVCNGAYDRTVAGVISGAGGIRPGIYMSQEGTLADGAYPVAIAGRVYVMADASAGPIRPGDVLTTSPTPGHSMRASNRERAPGAVLGKAMTGLESGRGLVLVLVSLQ